MYKEGDRIEDVQHTKQFIVVEILKNTYIVESFGDMKIIYKKVLENKELFVKMNS